MDTENKELPLKRENEELRLVVEHSWEMVNLLKAYCDNPSAFSMKQKKDILDLYDLYKSMLQKLGFFESEIILPN